MPKRERPLPPSPAPDKPCVYGGQPSTGWRWFSATGWERVCDNHTRGAGGAYVPDTAMVWREGQ